MNFDNLAARIVHIDDLIATLSRFDPAYVERRLLPRRQRAWRTFRTKWSADCTSAQVWEFAQLLTKGAP